MLVGGDGKAFEAPLINVPHAGRAVMRMPALGMREGEPAKEVGDLLVLPLARPDDEVPMVGHHGVGEDAQRHAVEGFDDQVVEGGETCILLKSRRRPLDRLST